MSFITLQEVNHGTHRIVNTEMVQWAAVKEADEDPIGQVVPVKYYILVRMVGDSQLTRYVPVSGEGQASPNATNPERILQNFSSLLHHGY